MTSLLAIGVIAAAIHANFFRIRAAIRVASKSKDHHLSARDLSNLSSVRCTPFD